MKKYWVYYNDGYRDEDEGLEGFETKEEALAFIESRIQLPDRYVSALNHSYALIHGRALTLVAVQQITKIDAT